MDFLLRSAQIFKKYIIFGNLSTITQEGKRKMTLFFSSTFRGLTFCDIHFCIWKMSKFVFMGCPLWFGLVCKIPEFWRWKLWDQNFSLFNSGNIHIEGCKEPDFIFSIELRTKFVWSHGLIWIDILFLFSKVSHFWTEDNQQVLHYYCPDLDDTVFHQTAYFCLRKKNVTLWALFLCLKP